MKKKLNKSISDVNIDRLYKTAKTTVAIDGKLMVAGSNWFILFLVNPDQRNKVLSGMKELSNGRI
ncbi:MAG: hypothetical protein QW783_02645 [Candidatus Micrarchaeia archaeon]